MPNIRTDNYYHLLTTQKIYRKIPKIISWSYIYFSKSHLRGSFSEGLTYGREIYVGLYSRGDLTEGFLRYEFGGLFLAGLIFGILRYLPQRVFHSNDLRACYLLLIYFYYNDEANEKRYSPTLTPFSIPLPGRGDWVWATAVIPFPFRLVIDHSRKYHNIP